MNAVAFSRDGQRYLSGGKDGRLLVWDTRSGRLVRAIRGGDLAPRLRAARDRRGLASALATTDPDLSGS